jgi:hypothetical protein
MIRRLAAVVALAAAFALLAPTADAACRAQSAWSQHSVAQHSVARKLVARKLVRPWNAAWYPQPCPVGQVCAF